MLITSGRTMLRQTSLVSQLAEDLALDEPAADLECLVQRLAHPPHLLQSLVHFDALLLYLLSFVNELLILGPDTLTLTAQLGLELLQVALLVLDLLVLVLYLLLNLVNADHFLAQSSILFYDVVL